MTVKKQNIFLVKVRALLQLRQKNVNIIAQLKQFYCIDKTESFKTGK